MILTFSFFDYLPESFWFEISVNERSEGIHDEDGKRHAFRIAAPVANDDGKKADAHAIDELSARCHRRRDVVGSHEDGTQHESTAKDDLQGVPFEV